MSRLINITEIIKKYHKKLPYNDINLIISKIIKKPLSFIIAHGEYEIKKKDYTIIINLIKRRINNEPMAYIFGSKEFYGLEFKVNKNTLVPRPETEMMIEEIINNTSQIKKNITLIDIGTGSGCIIITLAKLLESKKIEFIAIDISKPAIDIAKQNAKHHKINKKINFINGDLLKPIIYNKKININSEIIITANLPYLTPGQIKNSPSIKKEPRLALVAGADGLKYYNQLFEQANKLGAKKIKILCEIDPSQKNKIKALAKKIISKAGIEIKKDLSGQNRLFILTINK